MADPETARRIAALEEIMAAGWWPTEHAWLGRWLLRAGGGFTGRANSVLPLGDPGLPVDAAVTAAESFYRERDLVPRFCVPHPLPPAETPAGPAGSADPAGSGGSGTGSAVRSHRDAAVVAAARAPSVPASAGDAGAPDGEALGALLGERGYRHDNPTRVMTATVDDVRDATSATDPGVVTWSDDPDGAWLDVYRYRGRALPPGALPLLTGGAAPAFASVRRDGSTAAVGRLTAADGWAGITAMEVTPAYRRRGLARTVLAASAERARTLGAHGLYLQVAEPNVAARALYASCGFADHHRYHYRVLDG